MVKNGDYKEALEYGRSIAKQYEKDHDYLFIMGGIPSSVLEALSVGGRIYTISSMMQKMSFTIWTGFLE